MGLVQYNISISHNKNNLQKRHIENILLSGPSNILGKIIINRISTALEQKLKHEQAGFRCNKWMQRPHIHAKKQNKMLNVAQLVLYIYIYINFIDFDREVSND